MANQKVNQQLQKMMKCVKAYISRKSLREEFSKTLGQYVISPVVHISHVSPKPSETMTKKKTMNIQTSQ